MEVLILASGFPKTKLQLQTPGLSSNSLVEQSKAPRNEHLLQISDPFLRAHGNPVVYARGGHEASAWGATAGRASRGDGVAPEGPNAAVRQLVLHQHPRRGRRRALPVEREELRRPRSSSRPCRVASLSRLIDGLCSEEKQKRAQVPELCWRS